MSRKSTQIALGGVFSALCLLLMFLTGLVPFSTYFLPAIAGAMLVAIVIELNTKTAVLVYVSVSLLSIFISPDREAALQFVAFFGYYPILKAKLESLRPKSLEYLLKLGLFSIAMVAAYQASIHVLGLAEVAEEMASWGNHAGLKFLAAANVVFLIYDFALSRYISIYVNWFKPTFLRR